MRLRSSFKNGVAEPQLYFMHFRKGHHLYNAILTAAHIPLPRQPGEEPLPPPAPSLDELIPTKQ